MGREPTEILDMEIDVTVVVTRIVHKRWEG
jgi:hypothetical protein